MVIAFKLLCLVVHSYYDNIVTLIIKFMCLVVHSYCDNIVTLTIKFSPCNSINFKDLFLSIINITLVLFDVARCCVSRVKQQNNILIFYKILKGIVCSLIKLC